MTNYEILKEYEEHKTPVPSYEEWLESESHCAVYSDINKWLKEENANLNERIEKLEELLIECREYFDGRMHDSFIKSIITKIDEVLK